MIHLFCEGPLKTRASLRCLMLGRTFDHYRIVEEIGAGGMGVVYRARDERLNRDVALKILPSQTDSERRARANLIREAQTASALNHPYICIIHEVGEEDGHIFVAMEYVRGQTLAALLSQGPMRPPDILRYGSQPSMLGSIAMFYDRDLREAERRFKLAMELNPNWVPTYRGYAICMRAMGRPEEAIASMKHARDLDPLSVALNTSLGWEFYYAHHCAEAIEQFQTSIAMDPTFLFAQFGLASAYQQNHMEKEAMQAWQDYITASGNSALASELAKMYANSGYAAAMRMFRRKALELNTDAVRDSYVSPMVFAGLQATLGNRDKAFSWLAQADTERSSKLLDLKVDPDFDSLRGDPRFTELVSHIGLP
jgi:tetratricopeptide (TPR) repeat protein